MNPNYMVLAVRSTWDDSNHGNNTHTQTCKINCAAKQNMKPLCSTPQFVCAEFFVCTDFWLNYIATADKFRVLCLISIVSNIAIVILSNISVSLWIMDLFGNHLFLPEFAAKYLECHSLFGVQYVPRTQILISCISYVICNGRWHCLNLCLQHLSFNILCKSAVRALMKNHIDK